MNLPLSENKMSLSMSDSVSVLISNDTSTFQQSGVTKTCSGNSNSGNGLGGRHPERLCSQMGVGVNKK